MPFRKLSEVEFNLIWVGGKKMPTLQAENLLCFLCLLKNENTRVTIWVDTKLTYQELVKQMQSLLKGKAITFKNDLKHLNYKIIDNQLLDVSPTLQQFIDDTNEAKIWSGLSDIYRLLILSRKFIPGQPQARFYIEADSLMQPAAWGLFRSMSVAITYDSKLDKEVLFAPNQTVTDLLFLDINSPLGIEFANSIRPNLEQLVSDPELKLLFKELQKQAINNNGFAEKDILASYGMIINYLFRKHFLTCNKQKQYGYEEILIPRNKLYDLFCPLTHQIIDSRSWLNYNNPLQPIYNEFFYQSCMVRINQLSDTEGGIVTRHLLRLLNIEDKELLDAGLYSSLMLDSIANNKEPILAMELYAIHNQIDLSSAPRLRASRP